MPNVPLDTRFIGIAPQVNLTERKSALINAETQPYTMQDIVDTAGGGGSYLKYVALLTQTGTDAPVATVLENTLGGTPVWSYVSEGIYFLTLTGAFPSNKTIIFTSLSEENNTGLVFTETQSNNLVRIRTSDLTGSSLDDVLSNTSIEIRVYP